MKLKMIELITLLIFVFILNSNGSKWYIDDTFKLPRHEGIHIGYEKEIKVDVTSKRTHTLRTLSLKPLLFEIDHFLSDEECEYLVYLAKSHGLQDSLTQPESRNLKTTLSVFQEWDVNNDSYVDPLEFTYIKGRGELYLTEYETMQMIENLKIDKNADQKMDFEEFKNVTAQTIFEYFISIYHSTPKLRSRYSKQSWLWHYGAYDTLLEGFHDRFSKLTMLPHSLIEMSEPIQVVEYTEHGHYHCHHDSDEITQQLPCCTYANQNIMPCRLCRYLTVLVYLNNVTHGGETAFTVANNQTFSYEDWTYESTLKCNLADNCHKSNLVLKPEKGKALLWYNHNVDETTGWLGDLEPMTFHGGCDVFEINKYVANMWINVIGTKGSLDSYNGWLGRKFEQKEEL